ncbi:hypothetical protein [Bradyrhizobium guangdongense]
MNFFIAFSLAAGCGAAMNSVIPLRVPMGTGTIACFSSLCSASAFASATMLERRLRLPVEPA